MIKAYFDQKLYCTIKWESIVFIKTTLMLTITYQGSCYTCTILMQGTLNMHFHISKTKFNYVRLAEGTTEISLE